MSTWEKLVNPSETTLGVWPDTSLATVQDHSPTNVDSTGQRFIQMAKPTRAGFVRVKLVDSRVPVTSANNSLRTPRGHH